jgi:hypothetical protein
LWLGSSVSIRAMAHRRFSTTKMVNGCVKGVATHDSSISKGWQSQGQLTLNSKSEPQSYGICFKDVWKIKAKNHKPGLVEHSIDWPLDKKTFGAATPQHGTSLFGSDTTTIAAFGATTFGAPATSATGGLFGSSNPATSNTGGGWTFR